ncbi:MAG: tetratricopeptide repeat protein [Parachlamydia sp.]|nr:tetratricopeptide repeat protein [Parachlamydia sp.]
MTFNPLDSLENATSPGGGSSLPTNPSRPTNRMPTPDDSKISLEALKLARKSVSAKPKFSKPMPAPPGTKTAGSLSAAPSSFDQDSWKAQSDWHFARGEFGAALEASTKRLKRAEEQKASSAIAETLRDIGKITLGQGDFVKAAQIFNASFALYQRQSPVDENAQRLVLNYMLETETAFLTKEGFTEAKNVLKSPDIYQQRRAALGKMRKELKEKNNRKESTEKILKEFSGSIGRFVEAMIQEMYPLLGDPPCEFALIGLGSLARQEMSPYSDLEFALLIKEDTPANRNYFRKMVRWLEIKVIHLGETKINIIAGGRENPVPTGFSFDSGGNTPFGKESQIVLMQTPQKLAQLQSEKAYQEDMILSNVLKGTSLLVGSESLFQEYLREIKTIVQQPSSTPPYSIEEWRALDLLSGHLKQFQSRIDESKKENPHYNVKEELYRLPSFMIAVLGDYFGVDTSNTWDKLDALQERKILCAEGVAHLKEAMARALRLRIRCHLHYQREGDAAYHPAMLSKNKTEASLEGVYKLSESEIEDIIWIHRVIFPLERAFKQAFQTKSFAMLFRETFYEDTPKQQAQSLQKLGFYHKAEECYKKAIILNPHDSEAHLAYTKLLLDLERFSDAQLHVSEVFKRAAELQDYAIECEAYACQAAIYKELGKDREALAEQIKSWEIHREHLGDISAEVAEDLRDIGSTLVKMGQPEKAVGYVEEALNISKQIFSQRETIIGNYTLALGITWESLDVLQAIRHYQTALAIFTRLGEDFYKNKTQAFLAAAHHSMDNHKKSIELNKEVLAFHKELHRGITTDDYAMVLLAQALNFDALNQSTKAKAAIEEAVGIFKRIFGENNSYVASAYLAFCNHYIASDDLKNAFICAQKALNIQETILGHNHPDLVFPMKLIAMLHMRKREFLLAKEWYTRALELARKMPIQAKLDIPFMEAQLNELNEAKV